MQVLLPGVVEEQPDALTAQDLHWQFERESNDAFHGPLSAPRCWKRMFIAVEWHAGAHESQTGSATSLTPSCRK